ncbi:MAG: DUF5682 family protein [Polyangiaceae bacterium]|jgi:hypothetical protein|nr:DUF5682 family protein [Polyangiaceae bacterium]
MPRKKAPSPPQAPDPTSPADPGAIDPQAATPEPPPAPPASPVDDTIAPTETAATAAAVDPSEEPTVPEKTARKPRARKKKEAPAEASPTAEGPTPEGGPSEAAAPAEVAAEAPAGDAEAPRKKAPRKAKKGPVDPESLDIPGLVEHILLDERVVYFGVKHFSPACAFHVRELIRRERPVAVLIEGPEDAMGLIQYMVHEDTRPPFTIFSSYVDKDNQFGLNGKLSPDENIPARYRSWWPFTEYAPEYAAMKAAQEVGALTRFIDAPLLATIPYHHVPRREHTRMVDDRHLAENRYFEALQRRQRRRSFEEFWEANFEVLGQHLDTEGFQRLVLTFAACARRSGGGEASLEADGTLLREALMRHHIDAVLKEKPEGKIVVVTGAFHSVALPFTRGQRPKLKADKNLETLLTGHSFQALAGLYHLNRLPAYGQTVWEAIQAGSPEPFNAAAIQLLIEVMRKARDYKEGVSTADSVGAYQVARNLAVLRRNAQITLDDLQDAIQMTYIKGDHRMRGAEVQRATSDILVGNRLGRVTPQAGQAPLIRDYYALCKQHKLDITGVKKDVRCDIGKQEEHRFKSAFLHQCSFLEIPMFSSLDGGGWNAPARHYKGPNIATGEGMDLITETWGVQWGVKVDDRLLELSDRGASVAHAAGGLLRERALRVKGQAKESTALLLQSAQMMLLDVFQDLLGSVEDAIVEDSLFGSLVKALNNFVVLLSYRDSIAPQLQDRVLRSVVALFNKSCLLLPGIRNTKPEHLKETMEDLQTLVRITLTFEAQRLDRQLLAEKLAETVADQEGSPAIRGMGYGVLFSFGATSERAVSRELNGYLMGTAERVLQAGAFLDGLFLSSKSIVMSSPRLLQAISEIIRNLDWATFKILLPDLRRAFTQFIPTEIDRISAKVSEDMGLSQAPSRDEPIPDALARLGGEADDKVTKVLAEWC